MKPQPRRHWLAAIFTVFALLTAGGAHAQTTPPVVTITDSTTAEYTNAAVTFTLGFSEPVTGFGDSYTVGGNLTYTITPAPVIATTYTSTTDPFTIVATPLANTNDGVLTITVPVDEVTSLLSTTLGNALTVATQKYDTQAPMFTSATTATDAAVGDPVSTVVYTAIATDSGDALTYSLDTGSNAMTFNIDANTGEVRYNVSPTTVKTSRTVRIFATDKGGNRVPLIVNFPVVKGDQPDFGFAEPRVIKTPGDGNFTFTATGGSGTGAVTYGSSDEAVATVDDTGEVTIVAAGATTITATKAADDNYNGATNSYILTVGTTHEVTLPNDASGNAASGFVTLTVTDTVVVTVPPSDASDAAVNNPPMGIAFSLTTDLALMTAGTTTLMADATVCLPTTDVPAGRNAVLYHYASSAWVDISTASGSTRTDHVCGETDTFSPFAVGYYAPGTLLESLDLGTVSGVNLNLIFPVTTAGGKTYYYLDHDGNGMAQPKENTDGGAARDFTTSELLDALLNGGANTIATQDGAHDGTEDERSVIIGEYTLVLPTRAELLVFVADSSFRRNTKLSGTRVTGLRLLVKQPNRFCHQKERTIIIPLPPRILDLLVMYLILQYPTSHSSKSSPRPRPPTRP